MVIKLPPGKDFVNLLLSMETKPKGKWLSYGETTWRAQNISDALGKIGISRKKTYGYQERDEIKRQEFQQRLRTKNPHQIVYVDEAGIE